MAKVPELAPLGTPFKSNAPVELTESETEYVVKCVKHVFDKVVVFQVIASFPFYGAGGVCDSEAIDSSTCTVITAYMKLTH